MAPEFSPDLSRTILLVYLVFAVAVPAAIALLGWYLGRRLPPIRHVAPLALATLARWKLGPMIEPDFRRLEVLWIGAGVLVAIAALLRDLARLRRSPDDTPR